jgi:DNA-directed RNA polymerase beta subunit
MSGNNYTTKKAEKICKAFFEENNVVSNQIRSFDHFLTFGIQSIIEECVVREQGYTLAFDKVYIPNPSVVEEDRKIRPLFPMDARTRNLPYDSPIYCDLTETFVDGEQKHTKSYPRVVIGRMPIMLKCSKCNLSSLSEQELYKQGECPNDLGGYFIIKGNERVVVAQMRGNYNQIFVAKQRTSTKWKYVAKVRSMSDTTGHSVLIQAMIGLDSRTVKVAIPYIKEPIHAGIVFKALGFCTDEEISDLLCFEDKESLRYLRYILRDSFFIKDQRDAVKYIAQYTPVEKDENYAKQVIESEILPHFGVIGTFKEQACFIACLLRKLILTEAGKRSDDDLDNYANKRVDTTGTLFYDIFRNLFKKFTVSIEEMLENRKQKPDILSFISRSKIISKGLHQCLATGNWVAQKNASYVKSGVSQVLDRMTYASTISHLRRVIIQIGKEGKNTAIRQIAQSSFGYICPCECFAPDTKILLYSGDIVRADTIKVGDVLADDMGKPVSVRSTCFGKKRMFKIRFHRSEFENITVTDNHILTLMATKHNTVVFVPYSKRKIIVLSPDKKSYVFSDEFSEESPVLDISLEEYLKLDKEFANSLVAFKHGVEWEKEEEIPNDVTTNIPKYLLTTSGKTREKLLLTLGRKYGHVVVESIDNKFTFKNESVTPSLIFLARSLGKHCIKTKRGLSVFSGTPTSGFDLIEQDVQDFVGWQLNGNGRFLCGDFTVQHNTPEGGKIGTVLNLSLSCQTTRKIPMVLVRGVLEKIPFIKTVEDMPVPEMRHATPVFLNWGIIGYTQDPEKVINEVRRLRLKGVLDKEVSVTYDSLDNELKIFCDEGRFIRPLLVVDENNRLVLEKYWTKKLDWKTMLKLNIVQYVDPSEVENCVIAMNPDVLKTQRSDFCEIHPCLLLGVVAGMIPFPDHSQSPRNCYQCLWVEEKVLMANGEKKRISDVKVGDEIITVNPETCEKSVTTVVNQYVKKTDKPIVKLTVGFANPRTLVCTNDHPILTMDGWKKAGDLTSYDAVCVFGDEKKDSYTAKKNDAIFVLVKKIEDMPNVLIADITTASDTHSFITGNGICVHNSSMGKQALGMPALSYAIRTDTLLHVMMYQQKPLVTTMIHRMLKMNEMPSGLVAVVAIASYTGYNQEDGIIMNASSVDRGLFVIQSYHTIDCIEKKRDTYSTEEIRLVPQNSPPEIKEGEPGYFRRKRANYNLLDKNGVVMKRLPKGPEVVLQKGDVIVSKVIITGSKSGHETLTDASIVIQPGEEGTVHDVITEITPNGYKLVKVVIKVTRAPTLGDKIASRMAQKSTICMMYKQEDMPFTASGIVPDLIMNPLAIPSRMTTNQLIECVLGKAGCMDGTFADATPFTPESENVSEKLVEKMGKSLRKYGFQAQGWERMYNGMTGEMMDAQIFIGPTYYQRLKHMVDDKMHARATGHVTMLTRQPPEGRAKDGGLRFGETSRRSQAKSLASRRYKNVSLATPPNCGNVLNLPFVCSA